MRHGSIRVLFGAASALAAVALAAHCVNWLQSGAVYWPAAINMLGLILLTATGAIDPPSGRLKLALNIAALALILPSAIFILFR
jgi:hypothetical protein